jgi:aspartate dehydrogenase
VSLVDGALRVGLIGFGAIGSQVAAGIAAGVGGNVELVGVLVRHRSRETAVAAISTDIADFLAMGPRVVVETAGPAAFGAYAEAILETGASLISVSGSALLDVDLKARVEAICLQHGSRVYLPAGALAGLDTVAAAALSDLGEVRLRILQPGPEPGIVFHGSAVEGAHRFPNGLNIAALIAMVAQREVQLDVIEVSADHDREIELTASGGFGDLSVRLRPRPHPDRLSHIVALSLLASLRRLQQPIVLG